MYTCKMAKFDLNTVVSLLDTQARGIRQWIPPLQADALHSHPHGNTSRGLLNGIKRAFVAVHAATVLRSSESYACTKRHGSSMSGTLLKNMQPLAPCVNTTI